MVLWYKCASRDACPDVAKKLQAVIDARPVDALCDGQVKRRMILVPDPALETAIAASAYTFTYRADCLDEASLNAFITAHYGRGPEHLCFDGVEPLSDAGAGDAREGGGPDSPDTSPTDAAGG